jgi:hypothetical protein
MNLMKHPPFYNLGLLTKISDHRPHVKNVYRPHIKPSDELFIKVASSKSLFLFKQASSTNPNAFQIAYVVRQYR